MTEQAIYITRIEQLSLVGERYTRLYYGSEFCERLLPSAEELFQVMSFVEEKGLLFTLVTPCLSDAGLDRAGEILVGIAARNNATDEIVVNDWGLLALLQDTFKDHLHPVLGRLLTKQKRDPRIPGMAVPAEAENYFRSFGADTAQVQGFLRENGIERIELDNVFQGIRRTGTLKASLYLPYGCITTTRLCLFAGAENGGKASAGALPARGAYPLRSIVPCRRECRGYTARLSNKTMKKDIVMKGNTQFFVNERVPGPRELEELRVDRLVFQPEPPL